MARAFVCDYIRTPIGRYGGALALIRPDDLAADVLRALKGRSDLDWAVTDEVILGCANQAGEDNRNVARMATLMAGLPESVPALTVNRLCASGMDAVIAAARSIRAGEADLVIAGGVESMSRAPFVMPKAATPFARNAEIHDTTIGWRFVNKALEAQYGIESMPETAENVAEAYDVTRADQDAFALSSQTKTRAAQSAGRLAREIVPVTVPHRKGAPIEVSQDEHPRDTSLEKLAALQTPFRQGGTVTAGNASGVNDGAAALLIASEEAITAHGLTPLAEITGAASAGVAPRLMGIGPVPAVQKLCNRLRLSPNTFDVIELNEAFAAQCVAVLRELSIDPQDPAVNPNGGGIALGHPLGMSGARIVGSAALELTLKGASHALATMCVGVGQGVALGLRAP
ncbi:3-oxoadipyl-CoA thiolase [Roseobacter weihaiensis]|uniref:3-oxoadipyl-CoA thiolase n=1 Tax=Roseobacter weihaiensis TaxID=2763262 RepID=UPI001D0BBB9B|nr:3-oxoadipyl-CoA thiolase [Roseobacter sp. H9]